MMLWVQGRYGGCEPGLPVVTTSGPMGGGIGGFSCR